MRVEMELNHGCRRWNQLGSGRTGGAGTSRSKRPRSNEPSPATPPRGAGRSKAARRSSRPPKRG